MLTCATICVTHFIINNLIFVGSPSADSVSRVIVCLECLVVLRDNDDFVGQVSACQDIGVGQVWVHHEPVFGTKRDSATLANQAHKGNKALVEESSGKGYIITKGTYIGVNQGTVIEIQKDRIVVEEEVENIQGEITVKTRELRLPKPPGEE